MSKLIYGRNQQIKFNNEEEKKEAIDYILNSKNVDFIMKTIKIKALGDQKIEFIFLMKLASLNV